ncbi:MAG: hypothetical protein RIC35_13855 [Marinoscillum sp.]
MEKIERDFYGDDYDDLDDVLDQSFFREDDEMEHQEDDDLDYEDQTEHFRPISEL